MVTTSAPLLFFLPVLWGHALGWNSPEAVMLNVTSGDSRVLPCPCSPHSKVLLFQWTRPDLQQDGYVFDHRDHKMHPSYLGRVRPSDPHQNRICDVVLHNITTNDTGVYECWVHYNISESTGRDRPRQVIHLRVKDPPDRDNREPRVEEELAKRRSHYGLLFTVSLLILFLTIILAKKWKWKWKMELGTSHLNPLPPETNILDC